MALEARTAGGYEKIGMPRARDGRALHDDVVNAAAGALARAGARRRMTVLEGLAVEEEGIDPKQLEHDRGLALSPVFAPAAGFSIISGQARAPTRLRTHKRSSSDEACWRAGGH